MNNRVSSLHQVPSGAAVAPGDWKRANTDWFSAARWGVMLTYLPDVPSHSPAKDMTPDIWNRQIDNFNTTELAAKIADTGAGYVMFSVGQNSGYFCSPNAVYDAIVPHRPSRCSTRDLIGDLSEALAKHGVPLMVYAPSLAPVGDADACAALGFLPPWDATRIGLRGWTDKPIPWIDERLSCFQRNWEAVLREWSERWGKRVAGWFLDGCYYQDKLLRHDDEPNWRSLAGALRAGNQEALLSFNSGIRIPVTPCSEYDDYTAGEVADRLPLNGEEPGVIPLQRFINGAQYHIDTYAGANWAQGTKPRFPDELVIGYILHLADFGGVSTWDVPILPDGSIADPFLKQLRAVGEAVGKRR